jgi:hypothetical protein
MPTPQIRWPNNAEHNRVQAKEIAQDTETLIEQAKEIAQDTETLIEQAIADIKHNQDRCELRLAYALKQLKHIQLLLTEAKVGK